MSLRIHPGMIGALKGIIPGGVSVDDFCAVTGMSREDSGLTLAGLVKDGIGSTEDQFYHFQDGDRLRVAIRLLEGGLQADDVSEALDWRDF